MDILSSPALKIFTLLADVCVIVFIFSYFVSKNRSGDINTNNASSTETNSTISFPAENKAEYSNALSAETVAVITAAVMAYTHGSSTGLRVRSIKRTGHTTSVWNVAGRNEYILTRL
jgi:hypothetical protein